LFFRWTKNIQSRDQPPHFRESEQKVSTALPYGKCKCIGWTVIDDGQALQAELIIPGEGRIEIPHDMLLNAVDNGQKSRLTIDDPQKGLSKVR